jgi:hypothetical protein
VIEHADFGRVNASGLRRVWGGTVEHRHPEDPPTQDAKVRDQTSQTLGGPELRLLSLAARFEDLVEHLDLSSQSVRFELLNSVRPGGNGQISDQPPIDLLSVFA